jgi:hypothetical protein
MKIRSGIKTEDALSVLAVMFLLFSAMLDPWITLALAVAILILLGIQQLLLSRGVR